MRQLLLGASLLTMLPLVSAQDTMDDALAGFDDELDFIVLDEEATPALPGNGWLYSGSLSLSAAYNLIEHQSSTGTDYSGLSKLRSTLELGAQRQIYDWLKLNANIGTHYDAIYDLRDESYTNAVIDEYRFALDILETWAEFKLGSSADLRIGRQVENWGYSDSLRVLDVLNALDNTEPGLGDIDDLREPSGMLKLSLYDGPWTLKFISLPEHFFSTNPPYGSDFYTLQDANGQAYELETEEPKDFRAPGWASQISGSFSGWDLRLNAARLWHDRPYLAVSNDPNTAPVLKHARINSFGFGLQRSSGSWLLKQESRYLHHLRLTEAALLEIPGQGFTLAPQRNVNRNRLDTLIGLEYFGLAQSSFAVEIAVRWLQDFTQGLENAGELELATETAIRYGRDFLNERLRTTLLAVLLDKDGDFLGADGGAIYRISAEYELADALTFTATAIAYEEGTQNPFQFIDDNDRVHLQIAWAF